MTDEDDGGGPSWAAGLRRVPAWNALPGSVRRQLIRGRRTPQSEAEARAALAYARRTTSLAAAFVVAVAGALAGAAGWLVSAVLMGRGLTAALPGAVAFALTWLVVGTVFGRRRSRRLAARAEEVLRRA